MSNGISLKREAICGTPDLRTATVCHIERFFLTGRQSNKRTAWKTLAYSKKWGNHALTASLHIFIYNMVRRHETIKTTPAIALGIVDLQWTLEDVVEMTDEYLCAVDNARFEAAFVARFNERPTSNRTYPEFRSSRSARKNFPLTDFRRAGVPSLLACGFGRCSEEDPVAERPPGLG